MTDYRIKIYPERYQERYEPQVWRWYWPFWCALQHGAYAGACRFPMSYATKAEAFAVIEADMAAASYDPSTYEYIGPAMFGKGDPK